jgi:hypothetical protein
MVPLTGCKRPVTASDVASDEIVSDSVKPALEWTISEIPPLREPSKIGDARVTELEFVADDRLALGMYFSSVPDSSTGQNFRGNVRSNAAILIFDTLSGNTTKSKTWLGLEGEPAVSGRLKILPVGKGNFIVGVQDAIFRFSIDFDVQAERWLRPRTAATNDGLQEDYWSVVADSKGRSAMLSRFTPRLTEQSYWISPLTLADEQPLEELPRYVHSISAIVDRTLVSNWNYLDTNPHPVMAEERSAPIRPLCSECTGAVSATLGNNLILLSTRPAGSYVVVDLTGTVIFRGVHSGAHASIVTSSGAADSNRAALDYFEGKFPKGPTTVHFAVVDVDAKKEIWRLDRKIELSKSEIGGFHVTGFTPPTIAFSPDGHKLAILSNGLLQVYLIP